MDEARIREIVREEIDDQKARDFDPDPIAQARIREILRAERATRERAAKDQGSGHA